MLLSKTVIIDDICRVGVGERYKILKLVSEGGLKWVIDGWECWEWERGCGLSGCLIKLFEVVVM